VRTRRHAGAETSSPRGPGEARGPLPDRRGRRRAAGPGPASAYDALSPRRARVDRRGTPSLPGGGGDPRRGRRRSAPPSGAPSSRAASAATPAGRPAALLLQGVHGRAARPGVAVDRHRDGGEGALPRHACLPPVRPLHRLQGLPGRLPGWASRSASSTRSARRTWRGSSAATTPASIPGSRCRSRPSGEDETFTECGHE